MLRRLRNVIRAFLGLFIRMAEDPKVMLEQYIDDVRSKIPTMRATAASVIATELKLKAQIEELESQVGDLDRQIIAAVKLGPQYEAEAKMLIAAKATAEQSLIETKDQYGSAKTASEQARKALDDARLEVERRVREARALISQQEMIRMQEELSGLMASFEIGDQSDVLQRARDRIRDRAAQAQARVELATKDVDAKLRDIRRATAQIGVEEQLREYKRQLGMLPEEPVTKTMQPAKQTETQQ
ncbi:MAG: PspA/IM30 family protein [Armatimonadota bacterium]